jgi:hypothetical protein
MHKILGCFILLVLCSSCATIFNGKQTKVKIFAPENTSVVFNEETIAIKNGETQIYPERSKDSLKFTLINNSLSGDFTFRRKISSTIYLNLFILPYGGAGLIADLLNKRRFTYDRNLRFKIDTISQSFLLSKEKLNPFKQHTTFVYTSPLQALDFFSQPMVSLGVEYFPLDNLSVSGEYSSVFTDRLRDNSNTIKTVENKGRAFRYEIKYYNLLSISSNPKVNEYIGLEARFIRQQFNRTLRYNRANQDINFNIRESIAVVKSVNVFNLKYGLNYPIGNRMFIDFYFGLGVRDKIFKNPNSQFNPQTDELFSDDDDSFFFDFDSNYREGIDDIKTINLSLGFKFGIKI